jgi:hypothetical protein
MVASLHTHENPWIQVTICVSHELERDIFDVGASPITISVIIIMTCPDAELCTIARSREIEKKGIFLNKLKRGRNLKTDLGHSDSHDSIVFD